MRIVNSESGWTQISGEHDKSNFKDNKPSLDFINSLVPVTFVSIQEQNVLINDLKAEIDSLKKKTIDLGGGEYCRTTYAELLKKIMKYQTKIFQLKQLPVL